MNDFIPEGMKLADFEIEGFFQTGGGTWKCVDVGTRTVIAYNINEQNKGVESWDEKDNLIFYWYDFGGCTKLK